MEKEDEKELIWDILRRNYYQKTVSVTFSIFLDLVVKIEKFMKTYNIQSRSMAICYLIHLGFAFDLEKRAERETLRDVKGMMTVAEGRALSHVYDVEEKEEG